MSNDPELTDPRSNRKALGNRLRAAMKGRLTQEELAQATGASVSGVKKWLSGAADPGWSGMVAAAQACGVSLDWLATGDGPMRPDEAPPQVAIIDGGISGASAHLDEALMGRLVDGITAAYKDHGAAIAPLHLGQLAARLHNEVVAVAEGPEDYPGAVKMRLAQLRQELRQAETDPASSKRPA